MKYACEESMKQRELSGFQQTYLDVYRIIAAFLVLVGHVFSWYGISVFKNEQYYPYLQNIGVVMLFLLSGFLTAYSLEKKNKNHLYTCKSFARYKLIRILREYLPALFCIAIIDRISILCSRDAYSFYSAYNPIQFLGNLLMLQGTSVNSIPGLNVIPFGSARPLWTLSVEWWFYLIFASVYLAISNNKKINLKDIGIFIILLIMPLDYYIGGRGNGLGFVFFLGIIGYYIYNNLEYIVSLCLFVISCLGYVLYGCICKDAYTPLSYLIMSILFCSGLSLCGYNAKCKERNYVLSLMSKSTFMLYMLHYSIINLIWTMGIISGVYKKSLLSIVISILVSTAVYYIFGKRDWISIIRNKIWH